MVSIGMFACVWAHIWAMWVYFMGVCGDMWGHIYVEVQGLHWESPTTPQIFIEAVSQISGSFICSFSSHLDPRL